MCKRHHYFFQQNFYKTEKMDESGWHLALSIFIKPGYRLVYDFDPLDGTMMTYEALDSR